MASASTPGSTGACSISPLLSPSLDFCASVGDLVLDKLLSDAFLECESEAFDGKARSDMSEFGADALTVGDRLLGGPCDGGGSDMLPVIICV